MATKRKIYKFRNGNILEVEEYHDGNYGAPGKNRAEKEKLTPEQIKYINQLNKAKRCRHKLLEYFTENDLFVTWTYEKENRPGNMKEALAHFQKAMRYIRKEYKKRDRTLFWIRNIEKGTRGAWHIHLVINEIGGTAAIVKAAWNHGGLYISKIQLNKKLYDEDFTKLANYMTKDETTIEKKKNGGNSKPRLSEANYSSSRNMPLKKPKVDKLVRWKKEVKPKKGYYIAKMHEGQNPITGYSYRHYTMIRIEKENEYERFRI